MGLPVEIELQHIHPGFTEGAESSAPIEDLRFAHDSPLEGGVSCELVSENAKFPASRENTGNFRNYVADAPSRVNENHPILR